MSPLWCHQAKHSWAAQPFQISCHRCAGYRLACSWTWLSYLHLWRHKENKENSSLLSHCTHITWCQILLKGTGRGSVNTRPWRGNSGNSGKFWNAQMEMAGGGVWSFSIIVRELDIEILYTKEQDSSRRLISKDGQFLFNLNDEFIHFILTLAMSSFEWTSL